MPQLLQIFNRTSLTYATSKLLSYLPKHDLQQLLHSLQERRQYGKLAHMIRSYLVVALLYQVDRSLYYIHFEEDGMKELRRERCDLIAGNMKENMLKNVLFCWEKIQKEIQENFKEESELVKSYIIQPDLALPPLKRATVAPLCQTTYQIYLTVNRLDQIQKQQNGSNEQIQNKIMEAIAQILEFQVKLMQVEVEAIQCPLQLFTQLCYRFQIYRNTLLAFHGRFTLKKMSNYMKIWWNIMQPYYYITNHIFVSLLVGFEDREVYEIAWATEEIIIDEGYVRDYAESLIDLSITEENAAFCGHSKHRLEGPYKMLENQLFKRLQINKGLTSLQQNQDFMNKCFDFGLKSHTVCRISQIICSDPSDSLCRNDSFIQKCAQINGLSTIRIVQCICG